MATILLVEDEERMADVLKKGLEEEGHSVQICHDGETGLATARDRQFHLVILDLMLPGIDGVNVCKQLREQGVSTPIIMLTARNSLGDKVSGLDSGADDYLTKPFAFEELLARIRVLLRTRGPSLVQSDILVMDDLRLECLAGRAYRGGIEISLSKREFALLEYLLRNADQLVTRTMIAEKVWNQECNAYSNVIDVFINHLRKKVDGDMGRKLIQTVRGRGFMMSVQGTISA